VKKGSRREEGGEKLSYSYVGKEKILERGVVEAVLPAAKKKKDLIDRHEEKKGNYPHPQQGKKGGKSQRERSGIRPLAKDIQ